MHLFDKYFKKYPNRLGIVLAIIGVTFLTPDTMVMRFSKLKLKQRDPIERNPVEAVARGRHRRRSSLMMILFTWRKTPKDGDPIIQRIHHVTCNPTRQK